MPIILLTQGKTTLVDEEDFDFLIQWKWSAALVGNGRHWQAMRSRNPAIYMSRVIMDCPKGMCVDHINRDPLDNRRSNLRICSREQNSLNRSIDHDNQSGFKGVSWHPTVKKWRAKVAGECAFFVDKIDAARAVDKMAIERWGEFVGYLNFPEEARRRL